MKIGNTIIDGWKHEYFGIGINLEFNRDRYTWFHLPYFTICVGRYKLKNKDTSNYISDQFIERKKIGRLRIMEHIEPLNNKRFFNLGINSNTIFIGRYQVIV